MSAPTSPWWLLDGALLGDAAAGESLRGSPGVVALYRDLGDTAAHVGPWLIPPQADIASHLDAWRAEREDAGFGIARIYTDATQDALLSHLHGLRYLHASRKLAKRFFFRYADHRGLAALWPSLRPAQQRALLGPIQRWCWQPLDGDEHTLLPPPPPDSDEPAAPLPLRLRAHQFQRLDDESRIGDMLLSTAEAFPEFVVETTLAQRYAATRAALAWSAAQGIDAEPLRMAVVLASTRSEGRVLHDAAFAAVAHRAQAAADPSPILNWSITDCEVQASGRTA